MKFNATHKVSFWGVPCYFNCNDNALIGVNFLCEMLLTVAVFVHKTLLVLNPNVEPSFPLVILEDYK